MGSGHFLVEAADFLARTLLSAASAYAILDQDSWKRASGAMLQACIGFLYEVFAAAPTKLGIWTARVLDAGERAAPPLNVTVAEALVMYALDFDPPTPGSRSFAPALIQAIRDAPRLGTTAPQSDPLLSGVRFLQAVYAELPREITSRLNTKILQRVGAADARRLIGLV